MAFAVQVCVVVSSASAFTFDDIHYWIGDGTNRAAVIIDWNNAKPNSSIVYGVRWDGPSTNVARLLRVLANEDGRLHAALSSESWGTWVLGFAYDVDGDGGFFDMNRGAATDSDDLIGVDDFSSSYYWTVVRTKASTITPSTTWTYGSGVDYLYPVNGDWFALKRINWTINEGYSPAVPVFAETPYAHQTVACVIDENQSYADPSTVLGAPAACAKGYPPWTSDAPVTPCNAAWSIDQLLTLAKTEDDAGGYVVVAFDHPVMDDPQNPFGLDFTVFGNAFQALGGDQYFVETSDPAAFVFASSGVMAEPGLVEVSQDGTNWFSFADGPFADDFAPTMSHLYDTNSPDASLFDGNVWWGSKADATLPVDPAVTGSDFLGNTLAEYAMLYNGSAGGTGFDIGGFALPEDAATGRKWIRYVRVTSMSNYLDADWTDVDAFADVAPAQPYDNWVRTHYPWADQPDPGIVGKTAVSANGKPNFYNAAFGTAPDGAPVESFPVQNFEIENGRAVFTVPSAEFAFDAFRIGRAPEVDGRYDDSLPTREFTRATGNGFESVFSIPIDDTADKAFYKVGLSAE